MASSYSGSLNVPAASCLSSAAFTSGGSSSRSRFASSTHWTMLAGELAMVTDATPAGCVSMYSIASMPPHDWPRRWIRSRPRAARTASTSSVKVLTVHSSGRDSADARQAAADLVVEDHPPAGRARSP